jgi:pyruvate formate lyase activating enzyme
MYVLDGPDDRVHVNWDLANECGEETTSVCPTGALYMFGQEMTVEEVLKEVEQDGPFYDESGGGITLSGGECLLQPDFSAALLVGAHERGINTAIETAGNVPWAFMDKVLPHVDLMLHDHKLIDPQRHRQWVGAPNSRIRENYKKAYETYPDKTFIARSPVVPGVNLTEEHVRGVLEFIRLHKNVIDYQLLPYHRYGEAKYGFLGRVYELADFKPPPHEMMQRLRSIIDEAFGRTASPR